MLFFGGSHVNIGCSLERRSPASQVACRVAPTKLSLKARRVAVWSWHARVARSRSQRSRREGGKGGKGGGRSWGRWRWIVEVGHIAVQLGVVSQSLHSQSTLFAEPGALHSSSIALASGRSLSITISKEQPGGWQLCF